MRETSALISSSADPAENFAVVKSLRTSQLRVSFAFLSTLAVESLLQPLGASLARMGSKPIRSRGLREVPATPPKTTTRSPDQCKGARRFGASP